MQVHVNSFIRRQVAASQFSHSDKSWEDLRDEVESVLLQCKFLLRSKNNELVTLGYREGVILVTINTDEVFSGVVQLTEGDVLMGAYRARKAGETPRKSVGAVFASKMPAKSAFVVLYASTVLAEDGDNELPAKEGNWEMISLNASPFDDGREKEMPISPDVLMANYFHDDGGTDTQMTPEEFVEQLRISREWWSDKAMCLGDMPAHSDVHGNLVIEKS